MKQKTKKKPNHEERTMRPAIPWLKLPVIPRKFAQILIFLLVFANIGVYYLISSHAATYSVRFVLFCATDQCSGSQATLDSEAGQVESWYASRVGKSFNRLPTITVTGSNSAAFYSNGSGSNTDETYYRVRADLSGKGLINSETKTVVKLGFRSMANCGVGSGVLAITDPFKGCSNIQPSALAHELGHTLLSSSNADHLNDGTLMHAPLACNGEQLGSCALNGNQRDTLYNSSPWFNGGGGTPPPPPPPPCTVPPAPDGSTDRLNAGQQMTVGQSLFANNGSYQLAMQGDGNLVIYNTCNGTPVWNPGLGGRGGVRAVLQTDGNFVVYNAGNGAVWASGTPNRGGAYIVLQTDGNLVIYTSGGGAVWSSKGGGGGATPTPPPTTGTRDRLNPGNELTIGQSLFANNGSYQLAMQGDGNLVIYNRGTGSAIWNPSLQGRGGVKAVFQGDGNFVVYNGGGGPVWASGSQNRGGAYIVMQTDGNLVIYTGGGAAIWASKR